ncbi:MAG: hypothetical protein MI920_18850 [Kiloniellales bacterium]|nr:hypothetical protein [Kiloniellales bacterium]
MGGPKPTLGYESRTAAVIDLRGRGLSYHEIAARIGVPPKTVAALESSAGRARHRRPSEANGRTVVFPVDLLERLGPHAAARNVTVNELARRIVDTVIDEDLVPAVLDDVAEDAS